MDNIIKTHAGQYPSEKRAEDYATTLRGMGYQVTVEQRTVWDVFVTAWRGNNVE